MSGISGYAAGAATALNYGTYGLLVAQSNQVQAKLDTLTEQISTGLVSSVFSGLGASAQSAINLNGEVTQNQARVTAINNADGTLTQIQSILGQIGTIASTFYTQAQTLNDVTNENVDVIAASARDALGQLAGLLDSTNGDTYLFAGSASGQEPVPSPDNILSSGLYTQINAAVQGLATNGAAATIAATLSIASSNAAGTSPFSADLSQPAAALQSDLTAVQVGEGSYVTIGVVASSNTAAISGGSSTTGSYVRDLMRSLATLGSLSSNQSSDPGYAQLVSDTVASLNGVIGAVADEQGILGNRQKEIDATGTLLSSANTALTSQISNIQDVDIASVSTALTQTQANLQASYKLISDLSADSLLKYLPASA